MKKTPHSYRSMKNFADRVEAFRKAEEHERVAALGMWRERAASRGGWLAPTVSAAVAGLTSLIVVGFSLIVATSNATVSMSQYWLKKADDAIAAGNKPEGEVTRQFAADMVSRAQGSVFSTYGQVGTVLIIFIVLLIAATTAASKQQGTAVAYRDAFEDVQKELAESKSATSAADVLSVGASKEAKTVADKKSIPKKSWFRSRRKADDNAQV